MAHLEWNTALFRPVPCCVTSVCRLNSTLLVASTMAAVSSSETSVVCRLHGRTAVRTWNCTLFYVLIFTFLGNSREDKRFRGNLTCFFYFPVNAISACHRLLQIFEFCHILERSVGCMVSSFIFVASHLHAVTFSVNLTCIDCDISVFRSHPFSVVAQSSSKVLGLCVTFRNLLLFYTVGSF
jgi:hypothetical protein